MWNAENNPQNCCTVLPDTQELLYLLGFPRWCVAALGGGAEIDGEMIENEEL